ncbi:MAG: DUF507 family protein [Xanthomonadaceae bacterium]|nr:DUF507 family protein [Xanthomonadaceae bacterium]
MSAYTTKETVKLLFKSIITRLENKKLVLFMPQNRNAIVDEAYHVLAPFVLSEEDLREMAMSKVKSKSDALTDAGASEHQQYRTAKNMLREEPLTENELNGFYFQESLKAVSDRVSTFLMKSKNVEDVFGSDEEIGLAVVDIIKKFNPRDLH